MPWAVSPLVWEWPTEYPKLLIPTNPITEAAQTVATWSNWEIPLGSRTHIRCGISQMRIGELLSEACYILIFLFQLSLFLHIFEENLEWHTSRQVLLSHWGWASLFNLLTMLPVDKLCNGQGVVLLLWFFILLPSKSSSTVSVVSKWKTYTFLL